MSHNQKTYDKFALQYHQKRKTKEDSLWNLHLDRPTLEKLMGEPSPHLQILDLGCGSGLLTRWLTDKGLDALGEKFFIGVPGYTLLLPAHKVVGERWGLHNVEK